METQCLLVQKTAVRFTKEGPAVYHSHHDLIRFWERAVKRAGLPMRLTQGFNPHPRIIFPHALGTGIRSRHEQVELELFRPVDLDDLVRRLAAACGDTLEILGAQNLPPVKKSRQLAATSYRIGGWPDAAGEALPRAVADILAMTEIAVERGAPGDRRRLDIRPYLAALFHLPVENSLRITLAHTPSGSGRPDEIARLAAEKTGVDWHLLTIEKTEMILR